MAAFFLLPRDGAAPEDILRRAPRRPAAAALFLLTLYALKGLSFFFPLAVLEAAGGLLFSTPAALALNLCGAALATLLPYFLGRREQGGLDALVEKHPRLRTLREARRDGDFLFVLLLRLTGVFPCDAVSFYLGAAGIRWYVYLFAGLLGMLPHLTATTLLGAALTDLSSEAFFMAAGFSAAVTAAAAAVWRVRRRRAL